MSNPILHQEKLLKPAVLQLGRGADQPDEVLRVLSLRALGNMALGAPKKVLRHLEPGRQGAGPSGLSASAGMFWSPRGPPLELKAPRPRPQVRQYRKLLLEKCLCSLRDPGGTSVPSEGMEALTKILAELREGDVGSFFNAISEQCRSFFDNVSRDDSLAGPRPGRGLPR